MEYTVVTSAQNRVVLPGQVDAKRVEFNTGNKNNVLITCVGAITVILTLRCPPLFSCRTPLAIVQGRVIFVRVGS